MDKKEKYAAVYVRVSTNKQDAENQLLQLRPYCEKAGYKIYKEYIDVISGGEDNRPSFNRLFKDAHQRQFDVLVFWSIDRFSRSGMTYTIQKLQELKNLYIEWDSFQEPYFRTVGPFGDALLGIMATLAKIERERISERTKAGLARRKARGIRLGRPPGSKDKKPRRTKGYWDNDSAAKGKRKKGGKEKPRKVLSDLVSQQETSVKNGPFILCPNPECSNGLRTFRFDGVQHYKCDKCFFNCLVDEYGKEYKVGDQE